jgi:threonine dehydrogenase-like Zn-dependent dehydrogenase
MSSVIFECVGVPGVIQHIFEQAPQNARVVIVGVCMETDQQKPMFAIFKELSVQYVVGCTPDEFAQSLELIASGKVDAGAMITGTVGLDEVAGAFAELVGPVAQVELGLRELQPHLAVVLGVVLPAFRDLDVDEQVNGAPE